MASDLSTDITYIQADALRDWADEQLRAVGLPPRDARLVADSLVQTSLWGIDSHGISRLPHYLRRLRAGSIEPRPTMRFQATGPCTGQLDGGHALGMVVCHRAMDEAVRLARESGVGIVGCFRSSHCGAIGLYGRQAARGGMIGIALTHSDAFVAPHFGRRAFLGTNPICIAVPCADAEPVCVDMATSSIAFNAVMNARRDGRKLPPGVALDEQGHPTDEADEVAALTPLAGHKGYALAMLIEILCGPLSGMPFGPHISPMYGDLAARRNLGSLMMAIDPGRFAGGSYLADAVAELAAEARGQLPADGQSEVLVPGDPEYRTARRRATEGIPLEPALIDELTHESGTPLPGRPL